MNDNIIEGRRADIPYFTSPPVLFVYEQTVDLIAGTYTFPAGLKTAFTPSRPLQSNCLYLFDTFDFAADVSQGDYQGATSTPLSFSMYVQSDAGGAALREPIPLVKYYENTAYRLSILGKQMLGQGAPAAPSVSPGAQGFFFNRLLGNVVGEVTQTAALLGKTSLTLTLVFSAQEIGDPNFIEDFIKRSEAGKKGWRK